MATDGNYCECKKFIEPSFNNDSKFNESNEIKLPISWKLPDKYIVIEIFH